MTDINEEFWKQLVGSIVRKILTGIGVFLATRGYLSGEQAEGLTRAEVVEYVVAAIFIFAPVLWAWAKTNFNVIALRVARSSETDKPMSEIKTETLEQKTLISSV